jgi:phosphoribosyl 1,2-cyclic phosphodiesterase
MALYFKSLCSSSGGNSLVLWTETTCIAVDCGFGSMKRCRAALGPYLAAPDRTRAVLLSHAHSDHVSHYPLRVLEQLAIPVYVHTHSRDLLIERHFNGHGFTGLDLRTFQDEPFVIGDFTIQPIELEHHPRCPTFGFAFQCRVGRHTYRVVTLTDFCRWENLVDRLCDADFIFVESNHDLELLELYYNPNSRFHSPNPDTAQLLLGARRCSRRPFGGVMLGHISPQRNRPSLALEAAQTAFAKNGLAVDFPLYAAPLREPSETIVIAP